MLMAGGSEIKRILIPAATYQAVCFDVWDLGFHKSGFFDDDTQEEIVQHFILSRAQSERALKHDTTRAWVRAQGTRVETLL